PAQNASIARSRRNPRKFKHSKTLLRRRSCDVFFIVCIRCQTDFLRKERRIWPEALAQRIEQISQIVVSGLPGSTRNPQCLRFSWAPHGPTGNYYADLVNLDNR